jgi:hypothetical protein
MFASDTKILRVLLLHAAEKGANKANLVASKRQIGLHRKSVAAFSESIFPSEKNICGEQRRSPNNATENFRSVLESLD